MADEYDSYGQGYEDGYEAARAEMANCCVCGRIVDTREKGDGGDEHGCEIDGEKWVCSTECWGVAVASAALIEEAKR